MHAVPFFNFFMQENETIILIIDKQGINSYNNLPTRKPVKGGGGMEIDLSAFRSVSTYDFKSRLSYFLRLLKSGNAEGIVVHHYNKPVALVIPLEGAGNNSDSAATRFGQNRPKPGSSPPGTSSGPVTY
jgi:antitoxin (DNA-binding transcriptional repressor) of toxin-antitoxin stability system